MRTIAIAISIISVAATACADAVGPPTSEDTGLVEASLAASLRDPESIILSDVLAASDPISRSGMTWICGSVRGKNAMGGFADPKSFTAMAITDPLSKQRKINWARIAENHDQVRLAHDICSQKFAFAVAVNEASPEVRLDLQRHSDLEVECMLQRAEACAERDTLLKDLKTSGFCISGDGQWRSCGS